MGICEAVKRLDDFLKKQDDILIKINQITGEVKCAFAKDRHPVTLEKLDDE